MAINASIDPSTVLILSNLALATAVFYLILLHHNETKRRKRR